MIRDAVLNTCIKTCQELPERSGNKGWVDWKIIIPNKVKSWNRAWLWLTSVIPLHCVCVPTSLLLFCINSSVCMPQHPNSPTLLHQGFARELNTGCSSIELQQEIAEGLATLVERFPAVQWVEEARVKGRLPRTDPRPWGTQPCVEESQSLRSLPLQRVPAASQRGWQFLSWLWN